MKLPEIKRKISKYSFQDLLPIGIVFIVLGIALGFGADILGEVRDDISSTDAQNITNLSMEGLTELGSWLPTLALIIVAAIIIGVVVRYFARAGR